MERLKLYRVDDAYVNYLHGFDNRVQFNKCQRRPYVGVVFSINGYQYFAPLESPKPNHKNIKTSDNIMKLRGGELGLIGFNNMIPVNASSLMLIRLSDEPDLKYRELLVNQLTYCNQHRDQIEKHALRTYYGVTLEKRPFLVKISCDFSRLENALSLYKK